MAKKDRKIDFRYNLGIYFNLLKSKKYLIIWILIISLMIEATSLAENLLFKTIIDNGTLFVAGELMRDEFTKGIITIAFSFLVIFLLRVMWKWLYIHSINILETGLILELKRRFFNHLLHLSHRFHTTHKTGSLISRLSRGAHGFESMTDVLVFNVAPLFFNIIVVGISLIYLNPVSAVVLIINIIIFVLYSLLIQHMQQSAHLIANETEDVEKANISDFFTNIDSIKYFGKEELIKQRFSKLSENTRNAMFRHWGYHRYLDSGHSLILGIGTVFMIYFPLRSFLNGSLSIGSLVFIYSVYRNVLGHVFGFVYGIRNFYRASGDFQDLFRYAKIKNEIKDKKNAEKLRIKDGTIEFRNVTFKYGKRGIFKHFNLKIDKNEKVALVGHSGSGKSTLVKLLYRFYDVDRGEILIDGRNIKEFEQESLRGELSVVPQECVLFDDSIYNNIAFSNPKASRKEILQAIKFSQLDSTIKDFPKKESTIVGERGVKLSGGEKQRVSIARAILANKKVLVLDEATSSLDSKTEHEIQKDLQKLMEGRTTIIIAHRLSTIMRADRIVVLDKGKIMQIGSHNQLIKQHGKYKELWNLQKGGYIK